MDSAMGSAMGSAPRAFAVPKPVACGSSSVPGQGSFVGQPLTPGAIRSLGGFSGSCHIRKVVLGLLPRISDAAA